MTGSFDSVWLTRLMFQRGLAAIYLIAFVSALNQFPALLGERGLLPTPAFLTRVTFRDAPSLFHFHYSDRLFRGVAWTGIALSTLALVGLSESFGAWLSFGVWITLWLLYLSIVNVGQTFYGFGWESMLLEAGFFASFLGPTALSPSIIPILALRFMLFRTELGAGLIKLRHDSCWRDLTCLYYHHETQPLPNPLSRTFHRFPKLVHRGGVVFSHFVQLMVPFGLFLPQPLAAAAGVLIILHQLLLIVSGNYAWLNWLTVVLGLTAFSDPVWGKLFAFEAPPLASRSVSHEGVMYALLAVTLVLGVRPTFNLFSKHQHMNRSYNALHLVNAYGAFGSITRERLEVVLEGAADEEGTDWKEYEFRAKPGSLHRRPPQVAPYHLRLDWLMWFLPLGSGGDRWFLRLVEKLLAGDHDITKLLRHNPFPDAPPRYIRARLYHYTFATGAEHAQTGAVWRREPMGEFLRPVRARERS